MIKTTVLYSCEAWAMTEQMKSSLRTLEWRIL